MPSSVGGDKVLPAIVKGWMTSLMPDTLSSVSSVLSEDGAKV